MFVFGSGVLIGTQLGVTPATPINFGLVQKVSLETSVAVKELYGEYAFPVAVGSGTRKVMCKATLARFSGQAIGRLFYNQAPAVGSTISEFAELHTIPASSPYTVTVANSGHFVADQGVIYASSGLPLIAVAASPAQGQYAVAAGVYTFAAADAQANVLISYAYTAPSSGQSLAIPNPLIGSTANFTATLFATDPTTNLQFSVSLVQCVASKFSFDTSLEDFAKPDFEFQAQANAAGQVMTFNFGEDEAPPALPPPPGTPSLDFAEPGNSQYLGVYVVMKFARIALAGAFGLALLAPAAHAAVLTILDGTSTSRNFFYFQDGSSNYFPAIGIYGLAGDHQADVNADGGLDVHVTNGSNASVGTNASTGPSSSTQIGALDSSGNLQAVGPANPLPTTAPNPAMGTIGSAFPASAVGVGAKAGALMAPIVQTGASVPINISTATTTQLVAAVAGETIYVTAFDAVAGGTTNFTFEYGTGSNCATGATPLTGAYGLIAQFGVAKGSGLGAVLIVPSGNALCAVSSPRSRSAARSPIRSSDDEGAKGVRDKDGTRNSVPCRRRGAAFCDAGERAICGLIDPGGRGGQSSGPRCFDVCRAADDVQPCLVRRPGERAYPDGRRDWVGWKPMEFAASPDEHRRGILRTSPYDRTGRRRTRCSGR